MVEKFPSLKPGGKICDSCRKQLGEVTKEKITHNESGDDDMDDSYICQRGKLESINECLLWKKLVHTSYQKEKNK